MRRAALFAVASALIVLITAPMASAKVYGVTRQRSRGWSLQTSGQGSARLVNTPAECGESPRGDGSLRFIVQENTGTASEFARAARARSFTTVDLIDIDQLRYHTCSLQNDGGQWPYIILRVDFDDDGTVDDLLFFEPLYQSPGFNPSCPDQGAPLLATWQQWNARTGCWWSLNGTANAGPGANVKPLETIIDAEPFSEIVRIDLVQGFGSDATYEAYVDDFLLDLDDGPVLRFNFERN